MIFIVTASWTDQGIRSVKEAPKRVQAAVKRPRKWGSSSSTSSHLRRIRPFAHRRGGKRRQRRQICHGERALGNVRTRTVRAWTEAEMTKLISELP